LKDCGNQDGASATHLNFIISNRLHDGYTGMP
jgi:hypothetical protein